VDAPVRRIAGKPDGGAKDVGTVTRRWTSGIGVRADGGGEAGDRGRMLDTERAVVVVDEVGPVRRSACEAAGAGGPREGIGEGPALGDWQLGLSLVSCGRRAVGQPDSGGNRGGGRRGGGSRTRERDGDAGRGGRQGDGDGKDRPSAQGQPPWGHRGLLPRLSTTDSPRRCGFPA